MSRELTPLQRTIAAQQRAAVPVASAWVSANAGSGKTRVLTDRVIRLMLAGAEPSQILSITDDNNTSFTSSDDGTGCNPFLEVLKSSMSSLLSPGVDEVINEVPSIEVDVSLAPPISTVYKFAMYHEPPRF